MPTNNKYLVQVWTHHPDFQEGVPEFQFVVDAVTYIDCSAVNGWFTFQEPDGYTVHIQEDEVRAIGFSPVDENTVSES